MTETDETLAALRLKTNVTWEDADTDERLLQAAVAVSARLNSLLGLPDDHWFSDSDGDAWRLFLDAAYYEFSNAYGDFEEDFKREIASVRLLRMAGEADAQAQG